MIFMPYFAEEIELNDEENAQLDKTWGTIGPVEIGHKVMIDEKIEGPIREGYDFGPDFTKPYVVTDTDGDRAIVTPADGIGKNWIVCYSALSRVE